MPEPARIALAGRVVTMDQADTVFDAGIVYVAGDRIVDVRSRRDPPPEGFQGIQVVSTRGTVYPGLIELHNHLPYNVLRLWQAPKRYTNRGQWGGTAEYRQRVTGPMSVLGRYPGLMPAVVRYVECKCLVSGVTTSQGIALFSNMGGRRYYRGIVRNVEQTEHPELPDADTRISDVDASDAERFRARLEKSSVLLLHLSEGTDEKAREHFLALQLADGEWALSPALAGIHAAALKTADFRVLSRHGASIVWSPLSNLLLYGATTRIESAREQGVRVGLGSDWSVSGSKNLLGELKVARLVSRELGGLFTDAELVAMATREAAAILKWDAALGSLGAGKLADLLVVQGTAGDPHSALLEASEADVTLVVIGGAARFGIPSLMRRLSRAAESIRIDGRRRVLHVEQPGADPVVGRISLADARDRLSDALRRLPELALALERGRTLPEFALPRALRDGEPIWFLALDEVAETGMELRPRLPNRDGHITGPELAPLLAPRSVADIVESMKLDPLTVADDASFFSGIESQQNLPEYVRHGLRAAYAGEQGPE